MLIDIAIFLAAAVFFVPLFRYLGLGAVLGYLAAGIAIGPWGLRFIEDVESILHFSEFGVVLLLFIIGLELQPSRLWTLRRVVFGLGGAQVGLTMLALAAIGLAFGLPIPAAVVAGFGLAMSSTAFVLQMLAEKGELATRHGRVSFAILLFQDLSVIPFMAIIPLLVVQQAHDVGAHSWIVAAKTLAIFLVVILGGRYALQPLLRMLALTRVPEIFTAATLLVVIATALAMELAGLSMSLGAFLAGVLLADSEYRHELQADIEPFKGLLLGLFFIAVGMSANVGLVLEKPLLVLGLVAALIFTKAAILYAIGLLARLPQDAARSLAFALPQGGEFAFVLFGIATAAGVLANDVAALLVVVVTLSMILTPPLYALQARLRKPLTGPAYDTIDASEAPVLIVGFGPFGQIIGRMLRLKKIGFTVLEKDPERVDFVRQFGNKIYYGDAARVDLLRAAHAGKAKMLIISIANVETSMQIAESVRRHFPQLLIYAVASDRQHALRLMDLGVKNIIRRSYFSSLEMARQLLVEMGDTESSAQHAIDMFRGFDEGALKKQQAVYRDEKRLIQTAQETARELEQLFEEDRAAAQAPEAAPALAGSSKDYV
jgi:glutathione-regulated potassium-efflux system ancillary protein KefC/glutathione-regulated potassium-efflux system protein KefB